MKNELPRSKLRGIQNGKERSKLRGINPVEIQIYSHSQCFSPSPSRGRLFVCQVVAEKGLLSRSSFPADAMKAFAAFVGTHPVFFHSTPFDQGFIKKAASQAEVKFFNPVHDTLPLAKEAWPSLTSYKLVTLAQHVGAAVPKHRALEDAEVAMAVLLAARQRVEANK